MSDDALSPDETHDQTRAIAEWMELPVERVLLMDTFERAACLLMLPKPGHSIPYPVPPALHRRPACENCQAPASGTLEGHPLCRFCHRDQDPFRKFRWEAY
jgi:hypothetical protein